MLVQRRPNALRLIRQHDHALAAGRLALAWEPPLSLHVVLATALHDAPWRDADRRPQRDADTGLPHDFVSYPRTEKYGFLARGLDDLETIHPMVGLLVSLHHESFLGENALPRWRKAEAARRERLSRDPRVFPDDADRGLALLQLFDNLSLFACLTPPGSDPEGVPGWLEGEGLYALPGSGPVLERKWLGPDRLALRPFPFGDEVELEIPYRDLPPGPFRDQEELDGAWEAAGEDLWRVRVVEGG